jgi:uncharacterized repeat protein (TIGR04076 family)
MAPRKPAKMRVTVIDILNGTCHMGMKVGKSWDVKTNLTPEGVCMNAFCQTIYPAIRTMRYWGEQNWDEDPNVTTVACPDRHKQVIYKIERIIED